MMMCLCLLIDEKFWWGEEGEMRKYRHARNFLRCWFNGLADIHDRRAGDRRRRSTLTTNADEQQRTGQLMEPLVGPSCAGRKAREQTDGNITTPRLFFMMMRIQKNWAAKRRREGGSACWCRTAGRTTTPDSIRSWAFPCGNVQRRTGDVDDPASAAPL